MPSLDEFFSKPEKLHRTELEKISGVKPCSKCNKDAQEAFWDPITFVMSWTCSDGHENQIKVNS